MIHIIMLGRNKVFIYVLAGSSKPADLSNTRPDIRVIFF